MTETPIQTFRERLPIVAKMVESAFNGDATDTTRVSFALIAYQHNGNHDTASMISNVVETHELIQLLLTAIAAHDESGHA